MTRAEDRESKGRVEPETDPMVGALVRLMGRPRPPVPPELAERVRANVHAEWAQMVGQRRRRRTAGLVSGLAALVLLALGLSAWHSSGWMSGWLAGAPAADAPRLASSLGSGARWAGSGESLAIGDAFVSGATVVTASDGRVAFRLADGTSVRLSGETRLRSISEGYFDLLSGAIYIDSPGEGPSLEIRSPFGIARDIGTQFELRLTDTELRLRVREGRVELEREMDEKSLEAEVQAGEEVRVGSGNRIDRRRIEVHGEPWEHWLETAPPFVLEGARVSDFVEWLGRESGWSIAWSDPGLRLEAEAILLHGGEARVGEGRSPELVLETCGMRSRLEEGVLHVFRQGESP